MAARVRLRLTAGSAASCECVGLLNGGFESEQPSVLLPARLASALFPWFPEGTRVVTGETADAEGEFLLLSRPVEVCVLTDDRTGPAVACEAYVSTGAHELLASDAAIDALGVRIESFHLGRWRFHDEDKIRETEPVQRW